jgi:hypothetical protein
MHGNILASAGWENKDVATGVAGNAGVFPAAGWAEGAGAAVCPSARAANNAINEFMMPRSHAIQGKIFACPSVRENTTQSDGAGDSTPTALNNQCHARVEEPASQAETVAGFSLSA